MSALDCGVRTLQSKGTHWLSLRRRLSVEVSWCAICSCATVARPDSLVHLPMPCVHEPIKLSNPLESGSCEAWKMELLVDVNQLCSHVEGQHIF